MPDVMSQPLNMTLLKQKLINELENLSNSKLSFFRYIFIFKEKTLVLMKRQDYWKFLDEMSTYFENSLQTKLPRVFYIRKYLIGIVFNYEMSISWS